MHRQALYICTNVPDINEQKGPYIHLHKSPVYTLIRALYTYTKEPFIHAQTRLIYMPKRAVYICTNEPCTHAQKSHVSIHRHPLHIYTKEPYIHAPKSPVFFAQTSPVHMHKRAMYPYIDTPNMHKRALYICTKNPCISGTNEPCTHAQKSARSF